MKNPIIFLHIPKTAGSTFKQILRNEYPENKRFEIVVRDKALMTDEFLQLPSDKKESLDLLYGHMEFGLHQKFQKEVKYITFLRDPVSRVISNYYYLLRTPYHPYYDTVIKNKLSLKDYIEQDINPSLNNGYIKFLSGQNEVTENAYQQVIENLENHFAVIGITEQFDESILIMKEVLKWKSTPLYFRQNVSKNKKSGKEDYNELKDLILSKNSFDARLYNFAVEKFNQQKTDISEQSISQFRRKNSFYSNRWLRFPMKRFKQLQQLLES